MGVHRTRRDFLADVGRGVLVAGLGSAVAGDMGFAAVEASDTEPRLDFGPIEPLVSLMQEASIDKLLPVLVDRLRSGTDLRTLVEAGALANARTFGGEDYVGFHTMMAIAPAYHMALELPDERRALPVLKVLYRNTNRIQEYGGRPKEVLHPVEAAASLPDGRAPGEILREAVRSKDMNAAEATFAAIAKRTPSEAFNALLFAVQDNTEVHRTVLPYRAWDLLSVIGPTRAHAMLRQSVRYCVKSEKEWRHDEESDRPRVLLPRLFDQYKLASLTHGTRTAEDSWVDSMSRQIFEATPDAAADAVAAALAEGVDPDAIGESIALAANQLVLRDAGRSQREVQANKPLGSVHGDSIGVHACDSANAWRNMARASNGRNTSACLILGAFQVAYDRVNRGGDFLHWLPRPQSADQEPVRDKAPESLLNELETAIRGNDQARACAVTHRIGELGQPARPVFELLLKFAVSEDGALHAEKFYRTVSEEFAATRPAFRWRQLVALARVTASEFGRTAPGYADACGLLKV